MYLALVFVHVSGMFVGVAATYGPVVMYWIARRTGQIEPIRSAAAVTRPAAAIGGALFGLSGIFGLAAAINGGFSLLAPWLVTSYVLFALLTIVGVVVSGPRTARIRRTLADMPSGPLPQEARAVVDDPVLLAVHVLDFILLIALVYVMVVKPFG